MPHSIDDGKEDFLLIGFQSLTKLPVFPLDILTIPRYNLTS